MFKKTAIIYSPEYLAHDTGPNHPESANRLRAIIEELNSSGILETGKCSVIKPNACSIDDIALVHAPDYVELVENMCRSGGGLLDLGDTIVCPASFQVALLAAGGAVKAIDLVASRKAQNALALVRPPGHHAGRYYALGFCLFNNVAIAASILIRSFNFNRILILDIDAHHGNGTQEIFYDTNKVLFISMHQDPTVFPGKGFPDEVGEEEGSGYNVNIPFPFKIGDQVFLDAFEQISIPIIRQYKPQYVLVSLGFDGHYSDPVAELSLSSFAYLSILRKIMNLASKYSEKKLVAVLEGGYSKKLGEMVVSTIAEMSGIKHQTRDKQPKIKAIMKKQSEKMLEEVKSIQSSFWKL